MNTCSVELVHILTSTLEIEFIQMTERWEELSFTLGYILGEKKNQSLEFWKIYSTLT